MAYQVFIRGVKQPGSEALVAGAIAKRYGLPADAVATRLRSGQFRVKANIDLAAAKKYVSDLDALGAIAAVVGADGKELAPSAAAAPSTRLSAPLPAATAAPSTRLSAPLPAAKPSPAKSPADFQTGLSAAFSGESKAQDLGALGAGDSLLSLTTVDGDSDEKKPAAKREAISHEDAFRPPGAEDEEIPLALEIPTKAPSLEASGVGGDVGVAGFVAIEATDFEPAEEPPKPRGKAGLAQFFAPRPRALLLCAVAASVVFGFIPAAGYARISEASAFSASEKKLKQAYSDVVESGAWLDLPEIVENEREVLDGKRRSARTISTIVWLLFAALFGFVVVRILPWQRWADDARTGESDAASALG